MPRHPIQPMKQLDHFQLNFWATPYGNIWYTAGIVQRWTYGRWLALSGREKVPVVRASRPAAVYYLARRVLQAIREHPEPAANVTAVKWDAFVKTRAQALIRRKGRLPLVEGSGWW